jgi:hypothetical protein
MNIGEKFLPVGTVLLLKGGKKRVMIIGLCPSANDVMYDYAGCLFPEGVLDPEKTLLFNHDQIEQVFHMGLQDEEQKQFDTKLKEELKKQQSAKPTEQPQNIAPVEMPSHVVNNTNELNDFELDKIEV